MEWNKSILGSRPINMITINNATCDTGYLYGGSLIYSKHGHHWNYRTNFTLHLATAYVKFVYQAKDNFKCVDNMRRYLKCNVEGDVLLQLKNRCMQDAQSCSYEQQVSLHKHIYASKFIMITFPENLFMGIPICTTEMFLRIT